MRTSHCSDIRALTVSLGHLAHISTARPLWAFPVQTGCAHPYRPEASTLKPRQHTVFRTPPSPAPPGLGVAGPGFVYPSHPDPRFSECADLTAGLSLTGKHPQRRHAPKDAGPGGQKPMHRVVTVVWTMGSSDPFRAKPMERCHRSDQGANRRPTTGKICIPALEDCRRRRQPHVAVRAAQATARGRRVCQSETTFSRSVPS